MVMPRPCRAGIATLTAFSSSGVSAVGADGNGHRLRPGEGGRGEALPERDVGVGRRRAVLERVDDRDPAHAGEQQLAELRVVRGGRDLRAPDLVGHRPDRRPQPAFLGPQRGAQLGVGAGRRPELHRRPERRLLERRPHQLDRPVDPLAARPAGRPSRPPRATARPRAASSTGARRRPRAARPARGSGAAAARGRRRPGPGRRASRRRRSRPRPGRRRRRRGSAAGCRRCAPSGVRGGRLRGHRRERRSDRGPGEQSPLTATPDGCQAAGGRSDDRRGTPRGLRRHPRRGGLPGARPRPAGAARRRAAARRGRGSRSTRRTHEAEFRAHRAGARRGRAGRHPVAPRARRPGRHAGAAGHRRPGDRPRPHPHPDQPHRHRHVRARRSSRTAAPTRRSATSPGCCAPTTSGASCSASRRPAPTSRRCAPPPSATATTGSSTARRSGRRSRTSPTSASCSPAPTRSGPSTRA